MGIPGGVSTVAAFALKVMDMNALSATDRGCGNADGFAVTKDIFTLFYVFEGDFEGKRHRGTGFKGNCAPGVFPAE
jgi:hypothetical protein